MSEELKPLSRRQIEELFLIEKPVLREQDGKYELDINNTVTAIYEALPDNHPDHTALLRELVGALEIIKSLAPKRDARLAHPRWAEIAEEALAKAKEALE